MNNQIKPRIAKERTILNNNGVITIIPKGGVIPFQTSQNKHWSAQPSLSNN
jgi:hypothetical protein